VLFVRKEVDLEVNAKQATQQPTWLCIIQRMQDKITV